VGANPEHRLAPLATANALPENHFCMSLHPRTQADFDNGNGSCQGRTSFDGGLLMKVAEPEPRCFERRGSLPPSKPQYNSSPECFATFVGNRQVWRSLASHAGRWRRYGRSVPQIFVNLPIWVAYYSTRRSTHG
jgi:hypothetical protein